MIFFYFDFNCRDYKLKIDLILLRTNEVFLFKAIILYGLSSFNVKAPIAHHADS